ncbi:LytR/AlgR family response regulator transcription factor [Agaribacterium sp. ZY112]|uniref:LytR/AlgR family response regulator transcription factor n=1 Tax=Agaribacterium sp. ZY112 TaxID=3233574 RepID=UPI003524FFE9
MKVLIIDDESLARDELRYLLKDRHDIDIVGEAGDIDTAEKLIRELEPDCLLLDINMPKGGGFELLERLLSPPKLIFTTAYTEFALKAFDVGACDYLVKPIEQQRLNEALDRIASQLAAEQQQSQSNNAEKRLEPEDKIFVKDGDACYLIRLGDIQFIESIGNYSRLYFYQKGVQHKAMLKRSLKHLESRLPEQDFIRINRQVICKIDAIENIETIEGGAIKLELKLGKNKIELEMSRRQAQELKERLSI